MPDDEAVVLQAADRGDRVFVDFNQNAPHATVFGAWSVRSNPAKVSTPFAWEVLDDLEPAELTLATVPALVAELGDPRARASEDRQSLEPLLHPEMPSELPRVAPSRAEKPA